MKKPKPRGPRKYVWRYLVDWESAGWNGVSYTGREPNPQRVKFVKLHGRIGKRNNQARAARSIIRGFLRYKRGRARMLSLRMAIGALGPAPTGFR